VLGAQVLVEQARLVLFAVQLAARKHHRLPERLAGLELAEMLILQGGLEVLFSVIPFRHQLLSELVMVEIQFLEVVHYSIFLLRQPPLSLPLAVLPTVEARAVKLALVILRTGFKAL
jgi:hypothetical protein